MIGTIDIPSVCVLCRIGIAGLGSDVEIIKGNILGLVDEDSPVRAVGKFQVLHDSAGGGRDGKDNGSDKGGVFRASS